MTVRVTTLKGADAGAYYVEALPSYYLQAEEPPGQWLGIGAAQLGLAGDVDEDQFLSLMAGMDPNRPERHLGRGYDEKSVRGFDVTASAPKSVSVLFALGDHHVRTEALAAHDAAVEAMTGWIERHAHTRYRIGGEVAIVDAEGIIAATFRQHTSRALDPQLHTHVVIANRVKSPDGRWLALDARLIKHDQRTLSALYHAGLRAELTRRLGVRWNEPEHGIAEIHDVPDDVLALFSSRANDVERRLDIKLDRFVATMGREPTPRERWKLEREAAVDSRPAKPTPSNATELHAQWAKQVRDTGRHPQQVVADAIGRLGPNDYVEPSVAGVVDQAIVVIGELQSWWRPTELHRELAAAMPTATPSTAGRIVAWVDHVATDMEATRCVDLSRPVPSGSQLRRDRRPVSESVLDRALTTQAILDQETAVLEWADRRLDYEPPSSVDVASGTKLNVAQQQAASAVAGHGDLVLIVGPAGTGKTTALTPAVSHLRRHGRVVFGVAPSVAAADVLATETGMAADTLDKLLIEHRLGRRPLAGYDLPVGATIVVDEAGMVPTAKLAELADLADLKGWRLALVGDPLQFSAVGRGGMFGMLVDTFGAIELNAVHRFAEEWERDATLQLRRGDVDVAELYESHGRLHGGSAIEMERAAVAAWWTHRTNGETTLLMAPTNDAVDRLNERAQRRRLDVGELNPRDTYIDIGSVDLYVGDEIVTRQNDRKLVTDRGEMVRNRAQWTITEIHPDHSITVSGRHGQVRLPESYVTEHVDLGYATTGHGAQGRTVRNAVVFLEGPTDVRNLYVPMSRGTHGNHAYIATSGEQTALDVFTQSLTTDWIDVPALTRQAELNDTKPHRAGMLDGDTARDLFEERYARTKAIRDAENVVQRSPSALAAAREQLETAERRVAERSIQLEEAHAFLDRYDRPLRRRGREYDLDRARQKVGFLPNEIEAHRLGVVAAVARIEEVEQERAAAEERLRTRPADEAAVWAIGERLARDAHIRSRVARIEQPAGIVSVLGSRPKPGPDAREWDVAAGQIDQHRTAFDIKDGIGPHPSYMAPSAYKETWIQLSRMVAPIAPMPVPTRLPEVELPSL